MNRQTRSDLAMSAAVLILGASLVYSGFSLLRLRWHTLGSARHLDLPELLAVGAAGAGIALMFWWLFALACALLSVAAQQLGSARVASVSGALAPAFMRRVVTAVLGLNLVTAPMAHGSQVPAVDPLWHAQTVAVAAVPAPTGDPLPPAAAEAVAPQWVPRTAETSPGLLARPESRDAEDATGAGGASQAPASGVPGNIGAESRSGPDVVVKTGDSLWSIVAAALGPYAGDVDVARSWPDWYRANRDTIGADPNIILPGQILHAP